MAISNYDAIIIGGGISGFFTLKHLIENGVTNVVILERNPEPFGVWNIKNSPSVNSFTHCVSSKLFMTISDFPMPEEYDEFPHHSQIYKYYMDYVQHFDLLKYVKFNTSAQKIYKKNDKWTVETDKGTYTSKEITIATGTVNDCPNIPADLMYKNFTGNIYHSDAFDTYKDTLIDKKILLIGVSETACDFAEELRRTNKITMSSRRGVIMQDRLVGSLAADSQVSFLAEWAVHNLGKLGELGGDYLHYKTLNILGSHMPLWWGENGHGIDVWKTDAPYSWHYYVKNRETIDSIAKGIIRAVPHLSKIEGRRITFTNSAHDDFDTIIFCTGYKPYGALKFIDKKYYTKLYKHIFSLEDTSLAFVGFIRPTFIGLPTISELQSRWIAMKVSGKVELPNKQELSIEINEDRILQKKRFTHCSDRLSTVVHPVVYANVIARKIKAAPNMTKIFFTEPVFFLNILFNSWNHHLFRLNDSNIETRNNARKNILIHRTTTTKMLKQGILIIVIIIIILILIMRKLKRLLIG